MWDQGEFLFQPNPPNATQPKPPMWVQGDTSFCSNPTQTPKPPNPSTQPPNNATQPKPRNPPTEWDQSKYHVGQAGYSFWGFWGLVGESRLTRLIRHNPSPWTAPRPVDLVDLVDRQNPTPENTRFPINFSGPKSPRRKASFANPK